MEMNGYKLSTRAEMAARGERPKAAVAISPNAVALARTSPNVKAAPGMEPMQPYSFAPDIYPDGMAMDSCLPDNSAPMAAWALQSIYHEAQGFFGYPYLAQLMQRAEYRHAAEIWAEHSVRKWVKILGGTDDTRKQIEREFIRLNVRDIVQHWVFHDHTFGRAQIFLNFGDADDYDEVEKPLVMTPGKINPKRPLVGLTVVEPVWSAPGQYSTRNPLRPDFYQPTHWFVYGRRVHASRMLTLVSRPVSDMQKPNYAFGGLSLTQLMAPYVDNWLRTRQAVSDMVNSYSILNLKTDMSTVLSGGGAEHLFSRIDMFNQTRDNRGTMVTDKDNEELANIAVPISGLSQLQAQAQEQLASVSRIPLSIYLQITPTGLNATNDGETRNFYADVHAYQEKNIRPHLKRVLDAVQLSVFGDIDPEIDFEFEPLWEMSDRDLADIRKADADADVAYVTAGIIDPEEVRERLSIDETSLYHGVDLTDPAPGYGNEGIDEAAGNGEPDEPAMDERLVWGAGVIFRTRNGRILLLKRSATAEHEPETWCFPGGHIEPGETPERAAIRETFEETRHVLSPSEIVREIDDYQGFCTYLAEVEGAFKPNLNGEHTESGWFLPGDVPEPLHSGVRHTLDKVMGYAMDEWRETDHPRDKDGKFSSGGGGGSSAMAEAAMKFESYNVNAKTIARELREQGFTDASSSSPEVLAVITARKERKERELAEWEAKRQSPEYQAEIQKKQEALQAEKNQRRAPFINSPAWKEINGNKRNEVEQLLDTGQTEEADDVMRLAIIEAVAHKLKREGFTERHVSKSRSTGRNSSRYLTAPGGQEVRLSDHEIPITAAREARGGPRWDDIIPHEWQSRSVESFAEEVKGRSLGTWRDDEDDD